MPTADSLTVAAREAPWDAVVIGAGPAGAVAARQLALQGKRVLLVEKARLPRDKVCGGCLGGAALEVLSSIGLGHIAEQCGGVPLSTFALASGGSVAEVPIGRRVAISRRTFDAALVRQAALAGVFICDQTTAIVGGSNNPNVATIRLRCHSREVSVSARVVVVASGLGAAVAGHRTFASPRSHIGLGAISQSAPCDMIPGALHMAVSEFGYVGITAVEGGRFDIAAAVAPGALAAAQGPGQVVHAIMRDAGFHPRLDLCELRWRGTPQLTRRTRPVASHRRLLIGDAAGYVEPFTGEGIGWAMHSAVLATSLLTGSLETWDGTIAARWNRLYESSLAGSQRSCRWLSQLLRVRPMRQLMTWGLRQAPALSRPIVRRLDRGLVAPLS
jgi:flavin-dependent dehydrogenase